MSSTFGRILTHLPEKVWQTGRCLLSLSAVAWWPETTSQNTVGDTAETLPVSFEFGCQEKCELGFFFQKLKLCKGLFAVWKTTKYEAPKCLRVVCVYALYKKKQVKIHNKPIYTLASTTNHYIVSVKGPSISHFVKLKMWVPDLYRAPSKIKYFFSQTIFKAHKCKRSIFKIIF